MDKEKLIVFLEHRVLKNQKRFNKSINRKHKGEEVNEFMLGKAKGALNAYLDIIDVLRKETYSK